MGSMRSSSSFGVNFVLGPRGLTDPWHVAGPLLQVLSHPAGIWDATSAWQVAFLKLGCD
jgi:hypothetical protein